MDVNLLLRGQSNAQLFADRGGIYALEQRLEALTGAVIHVLAEFGTGTSTIHSGSAFLDWDTTGRQAGLLAHVRNQSADLRDNPTMTLWLHNEDEQKGSASKEEWLREVRADADLVRDVLGQGADSTPYVFTPIPYNYGQNWSWHDGMVTLSGDASFNASMSDAFDGAAMDGDGFPNSSHMGDADVQMVAAALAEDLLPVLAELTGGAPRPADPNPVPAPQEPMNPEPKPPAEDGHAPVTLKAGQGANSLVLRISQDAYQGSAEYTVSVDGQQVGGTFTASALHGSGQSDTLLLKGDWAAGPHEVSVLLLNDAWGGSADTDRNLWLEAASHDDEPVTGAARAIWSQNEPATFGIGDTDGGTVPAAAAPEPVDAGDDIDWNAIAAQVTANFAATGTWYY